MRLGFGVVRLGFGVEWFQDLPARLPKPLKSIRVANKARFGDA